MRRKVLALSVFVVLQVSFAAAQPRQRSEDRVIAELTEVGPRRSHCGRAHNVVPMRYRVVAVEQGNLAVSQELDVLVSCPELHRVRFVPGDHHRLVLASRRPWAVNDPYPWPGHPMPAHRYWALTITRAQ